jgi:transcriptional regulator with XRE-family HTH domain
VPRTVSPPSLPKTPGDWLACYRYRLTTTAGRHCSPEELGRLLGVSGDTVRRWEAGQARPSEEDLLHFADACALRPIERAFLLEAFSETKFEDAPEPQRFVDLAHVQLSQGFPGYIYDSLFYVRAWNSYVDVVLNIRGYPPMGEHILDNILLPSNAENWAATTRTHRQARWLREFWFLTANLCGSNPYFELLNRLENNREFYDRWMQLALGEREDEQAVGDPYYFDYPELGTFRVSISRIALPTVYYLKEYVPLDETAMARMETARRAGKAVVHVLGQVHWAQSRRRAASSVRAVPVAGG